jgi:anti-anti-sigma factor
MPESPPAAFSLENRGDFTIVRITGPKIGLDSRDSLYRLVESQGLKKLVLNFADVRVLTSAPIGMLVNLKNKLEAVGGTLRLCQVDADIREILRLTRVVGLFSIYETEQDAIDSSQMV